MWHWRHSELRNSPSISITLLMVLNIPNLSTSSTSATSSNLESGRSKTFSPPWILWASYQSVLSFNIPTFLFTKSNLKMQLSHMNISNFGKDVIHSRTRYPMVPMIVVKRHPSLWALQVWNWRLLAPDWSPVRYSVALHQSLMHHLWSYIFKQTRGVLLGWDGM